MRNVASMASHYQYGGIFNPQRYQHVASHMVSHKRYCIAENFVNGVALSMLRSGKFRVWHSIDNIVSQNILSAISSVLNEEYYIYGVALSIWNISFTVLHYQCCIAEYSVSDVALSMLHRAKFRVNNIKSRNILSIK